MGCNASLSWTLHRHVLIVAQCPGVTPAGDWSEFLNDIEPLPFTGILVFAPGTKLTPAQRADVDGVNKRKSSRAAVLTDSVVSRGVVTALRWFGLPIKAFAPNELPGALAFLAVSPEHHQEMATIVERVQHELTKRRASA